MSQDPEQPLDPEHLEMLRRGVKGWNRWRNDNRKTVPCLLGEPMKVSLPPNEAGYQAMADAVDPTIFDLEWTRSFVRPRDPA